MSLWEERRLTLEVMFLRWFAVGAALGVVLSAGLILGAGGSA